MNCKYFKYCGFQGHFLKQNVNIDDALAVIT